MNDYISAQAYLEDVPRFTQKNEPGHTRELLRLLGHPEERFRVIHVAGTNGKGSVCAFLESILRAAGFRTGLFTSPHLVHMTERFQIDRREVSQEQFLSAYETVMEAAEQMRAEGLPHPTYFELIFAIGMLLFARERVEVLVCETGLGGRLDATNTIDRKELCVITSISLDHMEYLGDTIPAIAGEKAGILRAGVPVVYDASDPEAARVIAARARELNAPAVAWHPEQVRVTGYTDDSIAYELGQKDAAPLALRVPFLADYQVANSALAVTAARLFDRTGRMTDALIQEAVAATRWSGRMEIARPGVVLDGAHNADGIRQFLRTVRRIGRTRPVSLLFAASSGKDHAGMVRRLCEEGNFSFIVVTQLRAGRRVEAEALAEQFRAATDAPVLVEKDAGRALETALARRGDSVLFCAGSLYLIGELETLLRTCPGTTARQVHREGEQIC